MHNFAAVDASLLEGGYVLSYNGGFINPRGRPLPAHHLRTLARLCRRRYQKGLDLGLSMHINVADGHVFVPDADDDERAYLTSISGVTLSRAQTTPTCPS